MGSPAAEYTARDGTKELIYPRGPLGKQTYVASVGSDGVLRGVRNVLTDDVFNRIQPGLTEQEILQMIGPPSSSMRFPRSDTHAWDYRYVDTWGYTSIFSVTFDSTGRVVSKISKRLERDNSR
jgi:outer membrane protein assembly factor BamE (lipoprotein component of BamABCDE complex)